MVGNLCWSVVSGSWRLFWRLVGCGDVVEAAGGAWR